MASDTAPQEQIPDTGKPAKRKNPLRSVSLVILLIACLLFALAILMERRTPSSSQATVSAYVIGIAPEVTGRVIEVGVVDNSVVKTGQILFRIDPRQYELAVSQAEAKLAQVGQSIGASTANVDSMQARVVSARATRDLHQEQYNRSAELVQRGIYAQAKLDQAKSDLDKSHAAVVAAEADLRRAEEELGAKGSDNPLLKETLSALERAQLDLLRTNVTAPADGVVTNLKLAIGGMVSTGQSAMTFIDASTVWISAAFKENSLEKVSAGDRAEVLFDVLPGQVFPARVESIGMGVATGSVDPATGLPKISTDSGWVRTPQSFAVRLTLDNGRPKGVRYGSQANVVIYTGDNPVANAIGYLWMRFMSVLTYAS